MPALKTVPLGEATGEAVRAAAHVSVLVGSHEADRSAGR